MLKILHKFFSPKTDGPDSTLVKPSDWNDEHKLETTVSGIVIGRDTSGPGELQELPLAFDPAGGVVINSKTAFRPPAGTTEERPVPPKPGDMRFNTDTNVLEVYGLGGSTSWTIIPLGGMVPAGFVAAYAGSAIPAGWLVCWGQSVTKLANPNLFNAIGYNYGGSGDNFNVPNYASRALVGIDNVYYGLGTQRGSFAYNISVPDDTLPLHSHPFAFDILQVNNAHIGGMGGGESAWVTGPQASTTLNTGAGPGAHTVTISTEQPGAGIYWCIKGG